MTNTVLTALWQKTNDVFSTKTQLAAGLATKQDVLIAGQGINISSNGVISNTATEETISIVVTSEVTGFDAEGLVINVYYNNSPNVSTTVTLDENGMGTLIVPHDYRYRLAFPDVEGCGRIPPIVHTSTLVQRSIEVEYEAESSITGESVQITALKKENGSYVAAEDITITVTFNDTDYHLTTGSDGKASILVPYGNNYQVVFPDLTGYYMMPTTKNQTLYSNRTSRYITGRYDDPQSGLYIVASDGTEFTPDQWEIAVEGGSRQNSEAKVIKIATSALVTAGGVFGIDIDMVRNRTYPQSLKWAASNVLFNSIPEDGNSTSALYYYDGLSASKLIQTEGNDRNIDTPAVDDCLNRTLMINNIPHEGFLGSAGQWAQLWANITAIDDILSSVRPDGASLLGDIVSNKWTSTQANATSAYYWSSSLNYSPKLYSYVVVPFFAF